MKTRWIFLFCFGMLWILPAGLPGPARGGDGPHSPAAAVKSLDAQGRMQLSPEDRCPVCAMQVVQHRKFACAIELADGTTYYFCGTGCLIRSWMHPDIYLGVQPQALQRAVVRDYFTGDELDAAAAWWVAGSDVAGPMGPALVPLAGPDDVTAFQKRHGGRTVFRLSEMNDARWEEITGRKAVPGEKP